MPIKSIESKLFCRIFCAGDVINLVSMQDMLWGCSVPQCKGNHGIVTSKLHGGLLAWRAISSKTD